MLTFIFNYIFFVPALVMSHLTFFLSMFDIVNVTIPGPFLYLWVTALIVFTLHMSVAALLEERYWSNVGLAFLCYFTYAQLFILVLLSAVYHNLTSMLFKRRLNWVKTARTEEKE